MNKQSMKVNYTVEELLVGFVVVDEDKKPIGGDSFYFGDVHENLQDRVSLYGLNKLLTDRTSDYKDKVEKLIKMREVFDSLIDGEWAKERVVGAPVVSVEVEALAQIKELSVPQAQAALAKYDKDVRAQILGSEAVQKVAQEIRELRAATDVVSLDDMI